MEPNKYSIFLEVARQKSISRAAEELGYTQSGVSHTITRFEQEINLSLFERSRTGVSLTNAGQEILPYVAQLEQCRQNLDQTILSLHNIQRGTLNIGTYSSISRKWLPKIIRAFKADYPSIRIHFKEGGYEEIISWLKNHEVDLGFFSTESPEEYEWIPLAEDPLMAVIPLDQDIGEDDYPIDLFNDSTFIISTLGIDRDIHNTIEQYHITPDIQYSAMDDYTIIAMVASGLGTSILPGLVLDHTHDTVIAKPLSPSVSRKLGIGILSKETASPSALEFIRYSRDFVNAHYNRKEIL